MADKPAATAAKPKAFKPKAGVVRKSKAEREAHAKQEAEKAAARSAAAEAASKSAQTSKSTAPRKREQKPRDNQDASQAAVGGAFGAGTGSRPTWKKAALDGGRTELLEGQEGVRPVDGPMLQGQGGEGSGQARRGGGGGGGGGGGSGGFGGGTRTLPDGTVIEIDDDPEEQGSNINLIPISDDDDDNEIVPGAANGKARAVSQGRTRKSGGVLRPIRAPGMSDEEDSETDEERKEKIRSSRTNNEDDGDVDDGDEMEVDGEQTVPKQDVPSSPELSRRKKSIRKTRARSKDIKLAHESIEERAERLRLSKDVDSLKGEFLISPEIKKQDAMDTNDEAKRPEGKLFLFQFPPLVPFLVNQDSIPPISLDGQTIKTDPDQATQTEDPSNSKIALPKPKVEGMLTADEKLQLPPGRVGKLQVHKSGKVTLDWGGTDMEVRYGTQVDFLQDAVLVENKVSENDDDEEKSKVSQTGATTYALGQIASKMVVIPDWQKLYD